ncbi:MAG: hypothetical protein AAF466_00860 [Bacteroidota bacterium]
MEFTILIIAFLLIVAIAFVAQSIGKIKRARAAGTKLYKRSLYYALVAKLFVRDLPD